MRRWIAISLLVVLVVGLSAASAEARRRHGHNHTAAYVALGLASFAVFNQFATPAYARPYYVVEPLYVMPPPQVIYVPQPQVIYAPQPQVVVVPQPTPTVVYYPHGRYELRFYGTYYQWIWIPNPPW